ncbi:hypothetical protein CONLIGDRAFT_673431 [Coniochaeta ligniaria NRRL 30616]|uniref:Cyanovirin-N domain-containing protein n=1 Tax=Coniochaeta ligniaria NRRL 30616 TaxID=1408157 RepID=A0A1J7IDF6_9PEZI|nr:hypothetical protein CONLIGDRAFT_673431 [Coniochaeta ligniaria NRRL 30616]
MLPNYWIAAVYWIAATAAILVVGCDAAPSNATTRLARDSGEPPWYNKCQATSLQLGLAPTSGSDTAWDGPYRALFLTGTCENGTDPDRKVVMSGTYLNRCYSNVNGSLLPVSDGAGQFYSTCDWCYLDHPGQFQGWLICQCKDNGQNKVLVKTDLGEHLHLLSGVIGCNGAEGRPYIDWLQRL